MAERTSNKQIADKLDTLIGLLTAQAMPAAADEPATAEALTTEGIETVELDAAYLDHQKGKAKAHAEAKGEDVILYARKNKQGETKIAYALSGRYFDQIAKQPSHLGPIETFTA